MLWRLAVRAIVMTMVISTGLRAGALMPLPARVQSGTGALNIQDGVRFEVAGFDEPRLERARLRLGLKIRGASPGLLRIRCAGPARSQDESYSLTVSPAEAVLTAAEPLGILRGLTTFRQLADGAATIPSVSIEDHPRFPWRGLSLDVSRHFYPPEVLYRNLEAMAYVKLNVLHLHLSDDQGWRIESRRYPQLQKLGSGGKFYTQNEIRKLIDFAAERGIRIVPEFDIPGHASALLAALPQLGSGRGPYRIEQKFGVFHPTLDPTREETYKFLDGLIDEMAALFPDPYFHIGGDEVTGREWRTNRRIQTYLNSHKLENKAGLQRYFNARVQPIVARHGKKMEGWDEILDPALPRDILIQSWRGQKSLFEAVRLGFSGILSAGYYLDLMHSAAEHYAVDPLDPSFGTLTQDETDRILGGEAALWSEHATPRNIDAKLWPRLAAIAERLWSPAECRDTGDMYRRLDRISAQLDSMGIAHRRGPESMLRDLAGAGPLEPLRTFASALEPVRDYQRHRSRHYTQADPFDRLVDSVPPESEAARKFAEGVRAHQWTGVRVALERWRDAQPELTGRLEEVRPALDALHRAAAFGLAALDGRKPDPAVLEELRKPVAELRIAILPALEALAGGAK